MGQGTAAQKSRRELYAKFTTEQKAEIVKRAAKNGIAATICHSQRSISISRKAAFARGNVVTLYAAVNHRELHYRINKHVHIATPSLYSMYNILAISYHYNYIYHCTNTAKGHWALHLQKLFLRKLCENQSAKIVLLENLVPYGKVVSLSSLYVHN